MTIPNNTVAGLAEKLLPCPFCGAENVALWHANNQWRAGCAACGASTGPDRNNRTKDAAIAAWNRRASPAPSAGVVDALVSELWSVIQRREYATPGERKRAIRTAITTILSDYSALQHPAAPSALPDGEFCSWRQQDEGYNCFSTACGHEYEVNDGEDGRVELPYCPFCARRIVGSAWTPSDDATPPPAPAAEQGDDNLPGMWSHSDFTGGDPDERSHAERSQPEARGVECECRPSNLGGMVPGCNACCNANPVRADQPEGEGVYRATSEQEDAEVDLAAGLVKITMRLPIALADRLNDEAAANGLVFPAYVRQLLASAPAAPGAGVGVDEAMIARAEAYMLRVLPGKSTACLGDTFNFYELLTAAIAGKDGA